jgi:hypothetical protein
MTNELFTRDEATALIKAAAKGSEFCVHIRNDMPIIDKPDSVFSGCLSSYLNTSKAEALRLVLDMLSPTLESRGGRMRIRAVTSTRSKYSKKAGFKDVEVITYWLG